MPDLDKLEQAALQAIAGATDAAALDGIRVGYLGKKGNLTQQLKQLGGLPAEERPAAGQAINRVKQVVQQAIEARNAALQAQQLGEQLE